MSLWVASFKSKCQQRSFHSQGNSGATRGVTVLRGDLSPQQRLKKRTTKIGQETNPVWEKALPVTLHRIKAAPLGNVTLESLP